MAKKRKSTAERVTITLRLKNESERDRLHEAAEAEGFSTMAAWAMYHLRNQVKRTLPDDEARTPTP